MKILFRNPLGFLTLCLALALVLPVLMMDGMFMDAVMYTSVGQNLANGYGSPWFLYYSTSHTVEVPGFFENPPLGYWIFALFFKFFGNSIFVERFYVLLVFLLSMPLIMRTWNAVIKENREVAWLPVLVWSLVPITFWTYTHNMMENSMTLFVLSAVILAWKSAVAPGRSYLYAAFAGTAVFLAFMVKGLPGMFPLATVFVHWLVYRQISFGKMVGLTLVMLIFSAGAIAALFALPVSGESLYHYLFVRTLLRIETLPVVDSRFHILRDCFQQMLLPMILSLVANLVYRYKNGKRLKPDQKAFWFFLILGLCGVLPLSLTKVQRTFYLVPAIPLFAMAFGVLLTKPVAYWQKQITPRTEKIIFAVARTLLLGVFIATLALAGKPKRNQQLLADVEALGGVIGRHDTITAPQNISHHWSLKAYLMRNYFIQMEPYAFERDNVEPHEWLLMYRGEKPPFEDFQRISLELRSFDLYRREE